MAGLTVIPALLLAETATEFALGDPAVSPPAPPRALCGTPPAHWALETARGRFLVRIDEVKGELELKRELELLLWLNRNGFPSPQPLPDRRGRHYRVVAGRCVSVCPALPGTRLPLDDLTPARLEDSGRVLAELHLLGKSYKKGIENRFGFERLAALYRSIRDRLPTWYRRVVRVLDDEIDYLRHYLEHKLPKGIIHGDVCAAHLHFDGDRVVGVLDFEAAARGKFISDLATAVNALCFRSDGGYELPRFEAVVGGYEGVRPLSLAEWDAFPNELRFSALRFTITRLREVDPTRADGVDNGFHESYERLQILRRERDGGMEALLMAMATGYDYRKYQRVRVAPKTSP